MSAIANYSIATSQYRTNAAIYHPRPLLEQREVMLVSTNLSFITFATLSQVV